MEREADKPYFPPAASIYLPPPTPTLFMLSHPEIGEGLLLSLSAPFFPPLLRPSAVMDSALSSVKDGAGRQEALASSRRL